VSTQSFFQAIQNSELAISIGQSNHLYGALAQLFHIAGLVFILAPILLVNLRLLGTGLSNQPINLLVKATNPFIYVGLVSIITQTLRFG
jgi:Mg/Co/Ni transporter MgtE